MFLQAIIRISVLISVIINSELAVGKHTKGLPCLTSNGSEGTCRHLKSCWVSYEEPQFAVSQCAKFGLDGLICCPNERPAEQKCSEYSAIAKNFNTHENVSESAQPMRMKKYSHLVKIYHGPRDRLKWKCSGTIISERYILSSAACIESPTGRATYVWLGPDDFKKRVNHPLLISVKKRIIYQNYNQSNLFHDLGLLHLKKDIQFDYNTLPACLNLDYNFDDGSVTASDWDHKEEEISLLDHESCNKHFVIRDILDSEQICAKLSNNCYFRTGSPLQVQHPELNHMHSIVGVLSFRKDCLRRQSIVAYTRVSHFASWIESIAFK